MALNTNIVSSIFFQLRNLFKNRMDEFSCFFYYFFCYLKEGCSFSDVKGNFSKRIGVSSNEVLENQFRVGEVSGIVIISFSVNSGKGLLEVFEPPDESFEVYRDL